MESLKKNKILLSLFGFTFLAFVYYFFFSGSSATDAVISTVAGGTEQSAVGGEVLDLLAQMNTVQIDQTLFTSASWMSLKDISSPLPADAPGKTDLFAPIGSR